MESEVIEKLSTRTAGLTSDEAEIRIREFGKNKLPEAKKISPISIFLLQFKSPLIYVLLAAAFVSGLLNHLTDTIFICIVVFINAIIGTLQEWKAEQSAKALQQLFQITSEIRRDGQKQRISAENLVPGDLVFLESGSRVPADIRLIEVADCSVDESILTGESVPVTKKVHPLSDDTPVSDQNNMAFAGTTVVRGIAMGFVTRSGSCTEIGKIAVAVADTGSTKPPLLIRMEVFSRQIALVVLGVACFLGIIGLLQGMGLIDVFFFTVALAVSAIPEGLPVALTVVLSIATYRMSHRHVIIRKITAVESLGSCTLIASDKTGTLTVNEQTAHIVQLPGGQILSVSGTGYSGQGSITTNNGVPLTQEEIHHLQHLCTIATMSSQAHLDYNNETWSSSGDPIDVAFLVLARKSGIDTTKVTRETNRPVYVPFEADRRYAAAGFFIDEKYHFGVKGAVEAVIPLCSQIRVGSDILPSDHTILMASAEKLASKGYRVLAVAEAMDPVFSDESITNNLPELILLGLVGFIDPVRPDALESVQACQKAGVRVVMVTGDHPSTASAIARTLGISDNPVQVVTGSQMDSVGSFEIPEFFDLIKDARVFARVTPVQKYAIVDALIRIGNFVAVTGDGVNDAPALRRAHIGIAMGSGTDIAKDNAAMIITDDRFSSIVAGIEEGRYAYDNIRKVTYLLVSTGAAEVILFTLSLLAQLPIPFLAVQLLWLNLVTNGIQHIGLAFEPGERGAMTRPPRPPDQGIFNRLMVSEIVVSSLIMGLVGFGAWRYLLYQGYDETTARNIALLLFVLLENVHVFNCRSESVSSLKMPLRRNLFLVCSVIGAQAIHQISLHIPILQQVLGLQPISLTESFLLFLLACTVIVGMELFKRIWPKISSI